MQSNVKELLPYMLELKRIQQSSGPVKHAFNSTSEGNLSYLRAFIIRGFQQ